MQIFICLSQIFLIFFKKPIDKRKNCGIIKATKGKKSKTFSLGTTQFRRVRDPVLSQHKIICVGFHRKCAHGNIDARVKRKAERKFRSRAAERKRVLLFSHYGCRKRMPDDFQERKPLRTRKKREVLYVQIRFEKTCLNGGRSNVQIYERNGKIR